MTYHLVLGVAQPFGHEDVVEDLQRRRNVRVSLVDGSGGSILTDLITTLPVDQRYTYDFDGVSEVLDHILVTKGLRNPEYQVVHINSEYADQVSDHDPQVVRLNP